MSSLTNKKEGEKNNILYVTINGTRYYYPLNMKNAQAKAPSEARASSNEMQGTNSSSIL